MNDLAQYTLEDLTEELAKRCDTLILCMRNIPSHRATEDRNVYYHFSHGDFDACLGLTIQHQHYIKEE